MANWLTPEQIARLRMKSAEVQAIVDEVWEDARPRHSVVLADAYLEHLMDEIIALARHSRPDMKGVPAATYKQKSRWLAQAKPEEVEDGLWDELDRMHNVRRPFAHYWEPGLTFDWPEAKSKIDLLEIPKMIADAGSDELLQSPADKWRLAFHICAHRLQQLKAKLERTR